MDHVRTLSVLALLALAACGPLVVPADAAHDACGATAAALDASTGPVCWSGTDGVYCHYGPDPLAACLADPARPASATCN